MAQEQMTGGLLGAGHSWVAGRQDANLTGNVAHPVAGASEAPPSPRLLQRLADWAYHCREDAADALSAEVRLYASAFHVLSAAIVAILLLFAWNSMA